MGKIYFENQTRGAVFLTFLLEIYCLRQEILLNIVLWSFKNVPHLLFLYYMLFLFHSLVNAKVPNFPHFLANKNNKIHIMNMLLTFREMVRYIDL